jgi:hypothetical protein
VEFLSSKVKRLGRETNLAPSCCVINDIINAWSYTSTTQYVFIATVSVTLKFCHTPPPVVSSIYWPRLDLEKGMVPQTEQFLKDTHRKQQGVHNVVRHDETKSDQAKSQILDL